MRIGAMKLKAQVFCGEEPAIGPGRADLLDAIVREGSISGAGRAMGMSYRKTWLMVDAMNRCFAQRLVETGVGGGRDRGARVTDAGLTALAAYRALEARIGTTTGDELSALTAMLRAAPLPAKAD